MTKPATPPARNEVVEIDAMDVAEWESGQRTPQASDANLAELVRKTAAPPEAPARVQTVARERGRTQLGAPVIPRTPSRARTEPPGPPPEPARARTSGGGASAPPARATRVPDIPAGPTVEPRKSPARMTRSGIDFSLPVTATGETGARPARPEPRRPLTQTPVGGVDFALPVTATSPGMPAAPATATSDSGSRLPEPEPEPLPPTPSTLPFAGPPRVDPGPSASPFAERSRVGPGHNASPAAGAEPNTAWPPRPLPVDPSSQPPRLAAPDPTLLSQPPGRDDAGRPDRLRVGLSHRRLWWIGGGIASASVAAILVALALPNPEASEVAGTLAVQVTGPRRGVRPEPPVDRAAADLRERVRLARDAAAAGVPTAPPAVEHRPARPAPLVDPLAWVRSGEPESAAGPRHAGKRPARRLVVDYTARPDEPAPPSLVAQSAEDPAIGMARNAYTTGNQRLFVGDLDGAVRAYREALEIYPGYVGGYRGLGLAYEQLGDTVNALAALRAYVGAVPNARDIALVRKRLTHLQRR